MGGFINQYNSEGQFKITKLIKDLSDFGMRYGQQIVRNSQSVGLTEAKFGYTQNLTGPQNPDDDLWSLFANLSLSDSVMRNNIAFFNKAYYKRRDELRLFSLNDEIEDILDTLADEAIVYDEKNFAIYSTFLSGLIKEEIKEDLNTSFKNIYNYFGFNDGRTLWSFFRKWLIDGYLSFEIIFDDTQKNIIGFKEIDPISLKPGIEKGTNKRIYVQYEGQGVKERMLYDSQIIYISYSSINTISRVSYLERLIRSYNLLRIMEHTRIIWAVTNASYKMKFIIPVGGKSKNRAKQSLAQLMYNYKEQVDFDYDSGALHVNGKPMMQFSKEYWLPSKDGESPEIESLGGEGPELSDTETLKYFHDKLKIASKIPFNRFDKESPAGYEVAAEGMLRDEIKFSKFVNRLRSIFQEILVKPLYVQMILKHPELKDDEHFKMNVSVRFNKENIFDEMKTIELTQKRMDFINSLKDLSMGQDKDGNEQLYFSVEYLIKKYAQFSEDDLKLNAYYKDIEKLIKDGYKREDAVKIAAGEDKSKFKKEVPKDEMSGEDSGGDDELKL